MDSATLFYVLFLLGLANTGVGGWQVRGFLSGHPAIRDVRDLEEFKRLARAQMYQALAQIGLLGGAVLTGIYAMSRSELGLLAFLVLNGLLLGVSLLMKRGEEQVRSLPVADPALRAEYQSVCSTWVQRATPDF